jgi:UDPglucose 6-dehydrogenase
MNVSVVGLGKLGACMAAAMSHRGFQVVGVDLSPEAVAAVNAGRAPFFEPQLSEMLADKTARLRATVDCAEAVMETDTTFLVVPTPSDPDGGFSLKYVEAAAASVGRALRDKLDYHLVVLTSTVLPGGTQEGLIAVLEETSGKRCGPDFGVCYSPEFIALGTVIRDFLNPELLLIGEHDVRAGDQLTALYGELIDNDAAVRRMAIVNAELTKIALNTFVTTKITFANMLARMCQTLPGGDVDAVTGALGLDSRIGAAYLSAGMGYGGPCFPRDNKALRHWASEAGAPALLAETTDELNRELEEMTLATILSHCAADSTVAILGLTYKPGSAVLEGSGALYIAQALVENGLRVRAYDSLWELLARDRMDHRIELVGSLPEALDGANVVVLATPDPSFADLTAKDFGESVVVIDCWRRLRGALEGADGVRYVGLGLGGAAQTLNGPDVPASAGASANR